MLYNIYTTKYAHFMYKIETYTDTFLLKYDVIYGFNSLPH